MEFRDGIQRHKSFICFIEMGWFVQIDFFPRRSGADRGRCWRRSLAAMELQDRIVILRILIRPARLRGVPVFPDPHPLQLLRNPLFYALRLFRSSLVVSYIGLLFLSFVLRHPGAARRQKFDARYRDSTPCQEIRCRKSSIFRLNGKKLKEKQNLKIFVTAVRNSGDFPGFLDSSGFFARETSCLSRAFRAWSLQEIHAKAEATGTLGFSEPRR